MPPLGDGAGGPRSGGALGGRGYPDYPVVLSVAGRRCLVVGAGPVGVGKARGLIECGAAVTVVASEVSEALATLAGEASPEPVRVERRRYRTGEAAGYEFVVPATGDEVVDALVTADALTGGALVNRPAGDDIRVVHLPAVHREGPVTVAVSTGGRSPALARWLRTRIAGTDGLALASLGDLADLMAEARRVGRAEGPDPERIDWALAIDQVLPLVGAGRIEEARAALRTLASGEGRAIDRGQK